MALQHRHWLYASISSGAPPTATVQPTRHRQSLAVSRWLALQQLLLLLTRHTGKQPHQVMLPSAAPDQHVPSADAARAVQCTGGASGPCTAATQCIAGTAGASWSASCCCAGLQQATPLLLVLLLRLMICCCCRMGSRRAAAPSTVDATRMCLRHCLWRCSTHLGFDSNVPVF